MPHSLPLYKQWLSYLYPITIETANDGSRRLELLFYRGQYQLGTDDALYSDGRRYRPMLLAFDHLKAELPALKKILLLGTGLASAAHILASKGYTPEFTLVEYDKRILKWAMELLPAGLSKVHPMVADAREYMQSQQGQYDLVVADIFIGRTVPTFVTSTDFLEHCKAALHSEGYLVMNYIVNSKNEWITARKNIEHVFPKAEILALDVNRVIIAKV